MLPCPLRAVTAACPASVCREQSPPLLPGVQQGHPRSLSQVVKWEQSLGPAHSVPHGLLHPWEVLGCCSEKGFEVRLTWSFPKSTDSLPVFQFRSGAATQHCSKSRRSKARNSPSPSHQWAGGSSRDRQVLSAHPEPAQTCWPKIPTQTTAAHNVFQRKWSVLGTQGMFPGPEQPKTSLFSQPRAAAPRVMGRKGHSITRPTCHSPGILGTWAHHCFLSSPSQRAISTWALPKHLLEECRVVRLHRTPLQLTTGLGRGAGSLCSPWGSPCVPQRPPGDAGTCFLEGKASLLGRTGWLCHHCRQEAALGHCRAHCREIQGCFILGIGWLL